MLSPMCAWFTYLWVLFHSMNNPKIITYPRSGKHYLEGLILRYSSREIESTHKASHDDSFIITIARDPFDSIQSNIAMKKYYNPETYEEHDYIDYYVELYKFLNNNSSLVIDYNDLINFPEEITKTICELIGFENNPSNYEMYGDNKNYEYLVSSKTVKEYTEEYFKLEDISECYDQYNDLLSKAKRIKV
jgi:hypothetical protein